MPDANDAQPQRRPHLNDDLARRAREVAAREQTPLTRLIQEGLRLRLRPMATPAPRAEPLPVFHGGTGLAPGIDPLRSRALLDAADAAEQADRQP